MYSICFHSRWKPKSVKLANGQNIGPIALFDKKNNAIIMSHFMNFMGSSTFYDPEKSTLYYGPLGRAEVIPANFIVWTIFYHSCHGIRKVSDFNDHGGNWFLNWKITYWIISIHIFTCHQDVYFHEMMGELVVFICIVAYLYVIWRNAFNW